MRGPDEQTQHMFSYLLPEQRVPADHPLRAIRALTDEALRSMSAQLARLYSTTGRPSIPPEQLLRALLLQVLYTVRSERLLMEELDYNLLFRWFVGLHMDDPVWHPTTFTKNRDRLLGGEVAAAAWMLAASAPPGSTVGADKGYDTARFVDEVRGAGGDSAHRAEDPPQRHRRPDHPASRLPGQSTEAEVGRAGLRLAEDGWRTAEAAPAGRGARRLDRDLRGGRLQPRANANLGGDVSLTPQVNGGGLFSSTHWQRATHSGSSQDSLP